ncbi:2-C-methyl-D-erythritol 2,4-cyclodiphosphate synthase [Spongiibacter sp. KMU-158]|uniref:2-C-methyl-D-erythritol 2,4-cyclodiphosphate synthase n=1 Tax=Spongiibacter pelagi TaxID=2760804 RepID=A0A927GWX9_9GAMM|nr:2-C-methyl-D-erythritol 2,4-cyclodiphosphate synthase [Spongiibacter pelagi]MBD2859940.1 2-C-methyl-D-erythritol 2,4-cyclodiphosphate synthase [Spongiibacter pelagi]
MSRLRIGHGYDVHRFADDGSADAFITLCGVKVPAERPLLAHSDGDVALHALTDALLGALALGDIGKHFPDTDPQYKGADSGQLLAHCYALIYEKGYQLGNADITIAAQKPKLAPFIVAMRQRIAELLKVDIDQISVKATTTEKLGFVGRCEGIAVDAVVLLEKISA